MKDDEQTVLILAREDKAQDSLLREAQSRDWETELCVSSQQLFAAAAQAKGGCIVLDVRLRGIHGLELLGRLLRGLVRWPVLLVNAEGDSPSVVEAIWPRACRCAALPPHDQPLTVAIDEALRWNRESHKQSARAAAIRNRLDRLNAREREVLDLLLLGKSNRQIADSLDVAVRTVEVRRAKLMEKMQARSLAHLIRMTVVAELLHNPLHDARAASDSQHRGVA